MSEVGRFQYTDGSTHSWRPINVLLGWSGVQEGRGAWCRGRTAAALLRVQSVVLDLLIFSHVTCSRLPVALWTGSGPATDDFGLFTSAINICHVIWDTLLFTPGSNKLKSPVKKVFFYYLILLFSNDALNWLKVTVNIFIMLQKISISNKCCYFELCS